MTRVASLWADHVRCCFTSHYGGLTKTADAVRLLQQKAKVCEPDHRLLMFLRCPVASETSSRAVSAGKQRCSRPVFAELGPGQSYSMAADAAGGVPDGDGLYLHAVAGQQAKGFSVVWLADNDRSELKSGEFAFHNGTLPVS